MNIETNAQPPESAPSMEDTIREGLAKLEAGESLSDEPSESTETSGRDPATGRFVGKSGAAPEAGTDETADDGAEPPEAEAPELSDEAETGEEAEQPEQTADPGSVDVTKPPNTWRGEAKALYDALPPAVKAEVHKREQDFHRGIGEYRGWAGIGQSLHQVVQPHEPMIREAIKAGEFESAQEAIGASLNAMAVLRTGSADEKAAMVLNLVKHFGITPESLQAANERMQNVDPQFAALQQEIRDLRKAVTQRPAEQQPAGPPPEVISEVESFIADPKNEFAKQLRPAMASLIESGLAKSLQEAYDKACELDPGVKAKRAAQQQQAEQKRRADEAARARKAARVNVVRRGQPPTAAPKGTMEDTIRQGLRELRSR